jgi:hypothetical protein
VSGLLPGTLIVNGQGQQGILFRASSQLASVFIAHQVMRPRASKHQPGDKFRMPEDE